MKQDLDRLMEANGIDALLVTGAGDHNPAMVYLTGGGHLTRADLIKKRGETGVLFHGAMERDEAAKTGLIPRSFTQYSYGELLKEAGGDKNMVLPLRYKKMLTDCGLTRGRVALYGQAEIGYGYSVFTAVQKLLPEIEFVGQQEEDVLMLAMATKDEDELARIRHMGQVTTQVVGRTADLLSSSPVRNEILLRPDGEPLTIGDVKKQINLWLAELGAENPEGTIFAIGRDAGVPHSTGAAGDVLRLGQTIVYDIFPCEAGGGYFYDFTRTWCLGYATDEALSLYNDVRTVFRTIMSELKLNEPFATYQKRTCELFEGMGHPTIQTNPATDNGYVHSLGHGVGLHVHEIPFSGSNATAYDVLAPNSVATIEPGLYYPEKGLGVRLEDSVWARPDGEFEVIAPYPYDLVLPVKG